MSSSRTILLTTSRNPTPQMRTLCHDLERVIPKLVYVNRGKMSNNEVAETALKLLAEGVVVVERWQGRPGVIRLCVIGESGLVSVPPVLHVSGMRLQRDFGVSKLAPACSIVTLASSRFTEHARVADALSAFFRLPILSLSEAASRCRTIMHISPFNNRIAMTFMDEPQHVEVGPRITLSKVAW